MDLYLEHKLNARARKILIAIEDYLRIHPDKSFNEALTELNISNEVKGDDSQVLNRITMTSYSLLVTRQ